jgi:hypothetical protein
MDVVVRVRTQRKIMASPGRSASVGLLDTPVGTLPHNADDCTDEDDDDDDDANYEPLPVSDIDSNTTTPKHNNGNHSDVAAAVAPPPHITKHVGASLQRLRRRLRRTSSSGLRTDGSGNRSSHRNDDYYHHNGRKQNNLLVADHYRMSEQHNDERRVLLPGVPVYKADWARDSHDFFNLVVLVPVVALNIMNWNWDLILYQASKLLEYYNIEMETKTSLNNNPATTIMPTTTNTAATLQQTTMLLTTTKTTTTARLLLFEVESVADFWTGEWFDLFFLVTAVYFVVDLVWILTIPHAVKSPATIVQHHAATILYILIPYQLQEFRWCMGVRR